MKEYNASKLKQILTDKKINNKNLAQTLNVCVSKVSELLNGIEYEELIQQICKTYSININDIYKGFEEPIYMKKIREQINKLKNEGLSINEICKITDISPPTIYYIMEHKTFKCHHTTANIIYDKIINYQNNKNNLINENNPIDENKLNNNIDNTFIFGDALYNNLLDDANKYFNGNINDAIKFILNKHYYK